MGTKKLLEQIQNLENHIIVNEINKNTPPQILQESKYGYKMNLGYKTVLVAICNNALLTAPV